MTATNHSAPGQAAGYEYQRQLALVLLAEAFQSDPSVEVRLEALEDIELLSEEASAARNIQVKHHLRDYTLTDRSTEFWHTIRVWLDLEQSLDGAPLPRFQLLTTSQAAADSGVSRLRLEDRSLETADEKLLAVAVEEGADGTRETRKRFRELGESRRLALLSSITVLDASEQVSDLDSRLQLALGLVVPLERAQAFVHQLKGWWVDRSVELLVKEVDRVSGQRLYEYCDSIRDDYRRGSLTVTGELAEEPSDSAKQGLLSKAFVRQLDLVHAPEGVKDLAVRHFYRARAQRGRWAREVDDLSDDLRAFERTLTDEWETEFTALTVRAAAVGPQRERDGLEFSMSFGSQSRAQLRGVDEHVLCRGTLHGLADRLTIGWHPDFRELMANDA